MYDFIEKIYYFKGDTKYDPGWYFPEGTFDNGPYFCYSDAAADAGLNIPSDPDEVTVKRLMIGPKSMTLARIEHTVRSCLLCTSVWLTVIMFWYGVYAVTHFVIFGD